MDGVLTATWLLSAWLGADLVTGAVHWWEDRYGNPDWPVIGKFVVQPNILHHTDQRAFLAGNYWQRNWTTIVPALLIAAVAYACGQRWLAIVAMFSSQANELHGWAHQKCSRPIRGLQMLGILASPEDHAEHHETPYSTDFCVMTGWLNPVLERLRFWRTLEALVGCVTGIWPRVEREQA